MNEMSGTAKPLKHAAASLDMIYDAGFDATPEVTKVTANTFLKIGGGGHAGRIAYMDQGAKLYEDFKASQSLVDTSDPAQLISVHKSALVNEFAGTERLIVIGGGSYSSLMTQELALARAAFEADKKAPLKEIILIDVSREFLEEDIRAVRDFEAQLNADLGTKVRFDVTGLHGEFKNIAGERFDNILSALGKRSRQNIKSTLMMTGATFGNLEGVGSTDSIPVNDIDIQMAKLGEFVSNGDTVMFDYFSMMRNGENYYNHPALAKFFTNIPVIMRDHCKGLKDFKVNGDNNDIYFTYNAKNLWPARLVAHQLIAQQPQISTISNGHDKVLTIDGPYNVMYSLRPTADVIENRPVANTGLQSTFYVSSKDLVMHVTKKVPSDVSALRKDEPETHTMTSGAGSESHVVTHMPAQRESGLKRAIAYMQLPLPQIALTA